MAVSRDASEFMARHGIIYRTGRPAPRLDITALLVNFVPTPPTPAQQANLLHDEGPEPPDRGGARTWPRNEE